MSELITPNSVQGKVRGWQGDSPVTLWKPNLVMYDWATIVAKLVAGDLDYRVNGLYIEYENTAGAATIPVWTARPTSRSRSWPGYASTVSHRSAGM